jgi:hypothetical protein
MTSQYMTGHSGIFIGAFGAYPSNVSYLSSSKGPGKWESLNEAAPQITGLP